MKVLMLTTHLNMGGITRYLLTLTKGLIASGHQAHVVSSGGGTQERFNAIGVQTRVIDIKTKSELSPRIYRALKPVRNYIREHQIDVIHAQTRITQVMGSLLQKQIKIPYISTCHGYFKARLSRRMWPCWGDVIAISPAVRDHLNQDFHVDQKKIHLIQHGIDAADFPEIPDEQKTAIRKRMNLESCMLIGMVARLSDVKGQDILIRALAKILKDVPNVKLLLFGEGKLKAQLLDQVDKLHLAAHVHFYPVVDRAHESLSILDVCVAPSRQEGLGLSVMEAQACGVAVVASRVGGILSLIKDGVNGILVGPENADELAHEIVSLLSDKQKRDALGSAARHHALANYSAQTMINKTIEVYQNAARQT